MHLSKAQLVLLAKCGIATKYDVMGNGETRLRFVHVQGDECVITTGVGDPSDRTTWSGWQNTHQHGCPFGVPPTVTHAGRLLGLMEVYLPVKGLMVFAEVHGEKTVLSVVEAGRAILSEPGVAHNVLLRPGDVILTWKIGYPVINPEKDADWWSASDEVNQAIRAITLEEVAEQTGFTLEQLLAPV